MNFWHMQLHPDDSNFGHEITILKETGYIGMGVWNEGIASQPQ